MSSALGTWDQTFCAQFRICPKLENGSVGGIYVTEQSDLSVLSFLQYREKRLLSITRILPEEMESRFRDFFGESASIIKGNKSDTRRVDFASNNSIVQLIDSLINRAISLGASDIHFEPFEHNMTCRFRIDGILRHEQDIARESLSEIVARIKIMSDLDISEKRRPQDGRIRFRTETKVVDIRVSILPTDFGEKAVLRLLDKETLRLDLNLLGLSQEHRVLLEEKIQMPNGMILVTGPTGSGKTTTLYAVLNHLRSPGVNITTIEDPIEYNLEGINQTQIKPRIGLSFGAALRSILRQDPNIIMVGEIRDRETLDEAIRAALTGHLVLSTLHTNDAAATIARMLDLGAESYLLASTLRLIMAQRLVQTICPQCSSETDSSDQRLAAERLGMAKDVAIRIGTGCERCEQTGYLGRTAIYEMIPIDDTLARMISERKTESDMRNMARESGFAGLREAGVEKIKRGLTTSVEVLRAVAS